MSENRKNIGAEERWLRATDAFLTEKERTGASHLTIRNYSMRLNMFYEFWVETLPDPSSHRKTEDPSYIDFLEWRNYLQETGLKPTTIRQYLKELHNFYEWAIDPSLGKNRYYTENPISKRLIPTCRNIDKRPYDNILTNEEIIALYRNAPLEKMRWASVWPRNYAIVVFLMETELRNAELLDLRLCDLDFENEVIHVEHGKGNKYRPVDFSPFAQSAIRLYLASGLRPDGLSDDDYLFGTKGEMKARAYGVAPLWKRGTSGWLSTLVERHVANVTGVHKVRTHDLRHIGARIDLNTGMPIEELQSKLGHESVTTTQVYSGKLMGRRQRINAQAIPFERDIWTRRNEQMLAQTQG